VSDAARHEPRCPTCRGRLPEETTHRPFCSERCKLVDLGRWFNEEYVVPGEDAIDFGALGDERRPG
jgi:hypothetical protein